MWVVFLLAAMGFAIATLLVVYIGNKVINAMKRDDEKLNKVISKEKTNEKEKEKHE
nr:MAG TPA: ATP synthase subunit 9 [Caudoviricetes sp.]